MNADLIEKYLNGSLTAAEAALLAQALMENPALAEEFATATRMESDLTAAFKEDARTALYTRRMQRAADEVAPAIARRRWWKPAAAAAGLALLSGAGWAWLSHSQKNLAQKKTGPQGGGGTLAFAPVESGAGLNTAWRAGGSAGMKRQLRKFIAASGPAAAIRSLPVSKALAALEEQWKNYPHRDPDDKNAVAFTMAESARKQWPKEEDEPKVSLEIPGISLLTSVEVIAAQAGLETKVTDKGVTLLPDSRKDDGKPRTWTTPLAASTFDAFLTRARNSPSAVAYANVAKFYTDRHVELLSGERLTDLAQYNNYSWIDHSEVRGGNAWGKFPQASWSWVRTQNAPTDFDQANTYGFTVVKGTDTTAQVARANNPAYGNMTWDFTETGGAVPAGDVVLDSFMVPADSVAQIDAGLQAVTEEELTSEVVASASAAANFSPLTIPPTIVGVDDNVTLHMPTSYDTDVSTQLAGGLAWEYAPYGFVVQNEPPAQTFHRLLAAHGSGGAEIEWDTANGSVTTRGGLRELRAASAVLAALQEASTAGATLRAQVLEWNDGVIPPMERESGILSATEAAALTKQAANILTPPAATAQLGTITRIDTPVEEVVNATTGLLPAPALARVKGDTLVEDVRMTAEGLTYKLTTKVTHGEEIVVPGGNSSSTAQSAGAEAREVSISLAEGDCYRCDFPARGGTKAVTVLLRVQPAVVSR